MKAIMLDRDRVFLTFEQALRELHEEIRPGSIRPRTVAARAHEIYVAGLEPWEKRPALVTFRKFVAGKAALPEILDLLRVANITPGTRAPLDRQRVRAVFREAIQRLESRIVKGRARPLQIARRAYELYTRDAAPSKAGQPSHHTFERLIYGKNADPEILTLIESAAKPKEETP